MKAWGALVVAALALFALPAGAVAKPGLTVLGAERTMEFELPATNGFKITVEGMGGRPKEAAQIYIVASRGPGEQVQYLASGVASSDGKLKVKLPGVGRIAVQFDRTKETREPAYDGCKGRASIIQRGVFRGTIKLRGEQGYTSVNRRSAKGSVVRSFRQVCDEGGSGTHKADHGDSLDTVMLLTGLSRKHEGSIGFSAIRFDFGPKPGDSFVAFSASAVTRHDGFFAFHSVSAEGKEADFLTPQPAGATGDVTVTPPPPFHGSALFHLESPKTSTWTGDLGVELPGIGPVALAGSGFWSVFCPGQKCTGTEPPDKRVFSAAISSSF